MDIYCPKCREPWDMDCLHDEVEARWPDKPWEAEKAQLEASGMAIWEASDRTYGPYYQQVRKDFTLRGCNALEASYGHASWCATFEQEPSAAISAIYDLLGDDIDGAASLLDDYKGLL